MFFLLISLSSLISRPYYQSTQTSAAGLKTRHFNNIITELTSSLRIHTACGSRLGGVSLEFTGELNDEGFSVTECIGGSMELDEGQLGLRYQVGFFLPCNFIFLFNPCRPCFILQPFERTLIFTLFSVFLRSEIEFRAESRLVHSSYYVILPLSNSYLIHSQTNSCSF